MNKQSRSAGVLLHVSSLPGNGANGELGEHAFQFIDFLASSGIKVWQVLPLGPTMSDFSPYQSTSAFAGNSEYISIDELSEYQWFDRRGYHQFISSSNNEISLFEFSSQDSNEKKSWLKFSHFQFCANADNESMDDFKSFCEKQHFWLDEYAVYVAIKENFQNQSWVDWPAKLCDRNETALMLAREEYESEIEYVKFVQFIFFQQWMKVKHYANLKGIQIFGDLPLFVSHDSADVWANRKMFKLDAEGGLRFVAGVPPDYFSETGQRWGNPVYDWETHEEDGFKWWINRLEHQFKLFDYVRIDHFRGLESYWEIPADHETALNGYWVSAPGKKMLLALEAHFGGDLPLIAEDLGVITEDVVALKNDFKLPGMKILQFAFGGDSTNPYLPHNHEVDSVVYTGTHDNNTTLGWFSTLDENAKSHIYRYYESHESMPWLLIRSAYASVANMAILPMQDLMGLDETARMNVPGTVEGNWLWRFQWKDLDKPKVGEYLNTLNALYRR